MSFAGFRKCIQYWGTYILNKRKEGKKPTRGKKEKKTGGFFYFIFSAISWGLITQACRMLIDILLSNMLHRTHFFSTRRYKIH